MNIITNNCLGGFIYRDILKCEYQNPFIWTAIDHKDFLNFINDYEHIDFNNVKVVQIENVYYTIIDNKYKFANRHIIYSEKDETPRNAYDGVHVDWVNVYYNKPNEYILEKYKNRLSRMKGKPKLLIYAKNYLTDEELNELANICETNKFNCLIFNERKIKENEFVKSYVIKHEDVWFPNLIKEYGKIIEEFVNENRDNND